MLFFRRLLQVDKIDAVYFCRFIEESKLFIIFVELSKAEVGNAGEHPIRNSLMATKKSRAKGYQVDSLLTFLEAFMP